MIQTLYFRPYPSMLTTDVKGEAIEGQDISQSAAARCFAIPELRARLLSAMPPSALALLARTSSEILYEVVKILYRTLNLNDYMKTRSDLDVDGSLLRESVGVACERVIRRR